MKFFLKKTKMALIKIQGNYTTLTIFVQLCILKASSQRYYHRKKKRSAIAHIW